MFTKLLVCAAVMTAVCVLLSLTGCQSWKDYEFHWEPAEIHLPQTPRIPAPEKSIPPVTPQIDNVQVIVV